MARAPEIFDSTFETYSVVAVLGEGGSGRVFAVKDGNGNEFALKCLFPDRITTERRKRFRNEIEFCTKQNHRNLIRVADSGLIIWEGAKCPFYVMPRFPMTLRSLLGKGIPQELVLVFFDQILNGVEVGHLCGVFHRDLKPENVLYDPRQELLVVADLGIAHFEEDIIATTVDTKPTTKLANLRYSAPEQRVPGGKVDHRADIFALGLMLNEMFTGSVPQGAGYKTITSVAPQYEYLDPLVEGMIQQNPEARYTSIEEIKIELIARGNKFVALQQLDAKKREVVPINAPEQAVPITLLEADWKRDALSLRLNMIPETKWIMRFQNPRETFTSVPGAHPSQIQFRGEMATAYAMEQDVQRTVDYFKHYLEMANRGYQRDLEIEARSMEAEKRQQLAQELAEAEQRARVLKKLKI